LGRWGSILSLRSRRVLFVFLIEVIKEWLGFLRSGYVLKGFVEVFWGLVSRGWFRLGR